MSKNDFIKLFEITKDIDGTYSITKFGDKEITHEEEIVELLNMKRKEYFLLARKYDIHITGYLLCEYTTINFNKENDIKSFIGDLYEVGR